MPSPARSQTFADRWASDGACADRVLARLHKVRRSGDGWTAHCPAHEDRHSSLSVAVGNDGRVLLRCFAGCATEAVVEALGLKMQDLFARACPPTDRAPGRGVKGKGHTDLRQASRTAPRQEPGGLTLAQYAKAKRLPPEFLTGLGLTEFTYQGQRRVCIPYLDRGGVELAVRYRLALEGDSRFRWKKGSKPQPYGLQRLADAERSGYVVLVEGESDCHTLWSHGVPAVGVPGASSWREEWADHLDAVPVVYVVVEPDAGGEAVMRWLQDSRIRERVRLVSLREATDVSELYLADPTAFPQRLREALDTATPWADAHRRLTEAHSRRAWEQCAPLARQPRILDCFAEALRDSGVVGEERVGKLIYLAVTSRLLKPPVSIVVKGPSSAGKSFVVQQVLRFFPESAFYALTAMSERALAYSEEPLKHRFLVLYEAAGLGGEVASYLVRSILSEGRVRYATVEKTAGGLKPRLVEREGPTGLITTTTKVNLHRENETRLLSVTVNDTPEQTRAVFRALARDDGGPFDYGSWHRLQDWLETAEHRVFMPFAHALAEAVLPAGVRMRRDFGFVLSLVCAHAILHQANRDRDGEGRIIASSDDYAVVRELVADLVAEGVEVSVPPTIRETVLATSRLLRDSSDGVTKAAVARELGLDKSAGTRRVDAAVAKGYLRNLETKPRRPARLVLDDPLPEETEVLPPPEKLDGCTVAPGSGGAHTPPPTVLEALAWSAEQWQHYEERLAIATVEGGVPPEEAQRMAAESVERTFAAQPAA